MNHAPADAAITVSGLRKHFGQTRALDGLDLAVRAGEVHGFLGPDAAGKTTTIRVLLGLARADGGTARLLDAAGEAWPQRDVAGHVCQPAVQLGRVAPRISVDIDPGAGERTDYGLKCRLYPTDEGLAGTPPDHWVLKRRAGREPQPELTGACSL